MACQVRENNACQAASDRVARDSLCPNEWLDALSLDVWDAGVREKIESLQWHLGQQLLGLGLTVIIEWGNLGKG